MKEKNTLIANFLGLELQEDNTYFDYESCEYINQEDLNYDTSWDMLMQVVSKIFETDLYYSKYIDYNSSMFSEGKIELSTNITKVYEQCVEFVEWWNEVNNKV